MRYSEVGWTNNSLPYINATNLNQMDDRIYNIDQGWELLNMSFDDFSNAGDLVELKLPSSIASEEDLMAVFFESWVKIYKAGEAKPVYGRIMGNKEDVSPNRYWIVVYLPEEYNFFIQGWYPASLSDIGSFYTSISKSPPPELPSVNAFTGGYGTSSADYTLTDTRSIISDTDLYTPTQGTWHIDYTANARVYSTSGATQIYAELRLILGDDVNSATPGSTIMVGGSVPSGNVDIWTPIHYSFVATTSYDEPIQMTAGYTQLTGSTPKLYLANQRIIAYPEYAS